MPLEIELRADQFPASANSNLNIALNDSSLSPLMAVSGISGCASQDTVLGGPAKFGAGMWSKDPRAQRGVSARFHSAAGSGGQASTTGLYVESGGAGVLANSAFVRADSLTPGNWPLNVTNANGEQNWFWSLLLGGSDITDTFLQNQQARGSPGNQNWTGGGFDPTFLMLLPDLNNTIGELCHGLATSPSAQGLNYNRGDSATDSLRRFDDAYMYANQTPSSTFQEASLNALLGNGFQLNYATSTGTAPRVSILSAAGAFQSALAIIDASNSIGPVSYPVFGFQPEAVLFMSTGLSTTTGRILGSSEPFWGAATGSAAYCVASSYATGSTNNAEIFDTGAPVTTVSPSGLITSRATLQSLDPTGFTLNWLTAGVEYKIVAVGLASMGVPVTDPQNVVYLLG